MDLPVIAARGDRLTKVRNLAGPAFVWTVWAVMTAVAVLFIRHYGRNLPFMDDFTLVPMVTGYEPVSLGWLWSLHNEHRPVVSRAIMAGLYRLIAPDFRLGLYVNAGLLSVAAASVLLAVRRLRGRTSAVDVVVPLAVLNLGQAETLLIGFAMNLMLTSWIACVLVGLASRPGLLARRSLIVALGLLLVLLPLCGGSGLVMLPPLLLWLIHQIWLAGRGRDADPTAQKMGLVLLVLCLVVVDVYLFDYAMPVNHQPPPSKRAIGFTFLEYMSLVVSPTWHDYWRMAGVSAVGLVVVTLARLGWVSLRQPHERPRAFALAAVIFALLCAAVAVGISRSFMWPGGGLPSRYITTTSPVICALYVAWLASGPPRARRLVHSLLLVLVVLAIPAETRYGVAFGEDRLLTYRRIERCLKAHPRVSKLVELSSPALHPEPDVVHESFMMLKNARMGGFKNLAIDRLAVARDWRTQ
jgi:hypothetical protein